MEVSKNEAYGMVEQSGKGANTAGTLPDYVNDVYDVVAEPVTTLTTAQTKTGQKGEAEYL